ncbi:uncharacterized protein LOC133525071 [Cydia pomonella]|uniref:uncharacterized protein LOC133525071 n=1 Tax=Cydia pomonella TaxID=82600 RepID=UPI002ADDB29A|nr:uncharacterized protein LOC133525071 [Cydia pomonella]
MGERVCNMAVSTIVKCAKCNIVINEVLAFMQNKLEVMDNESLIRICKTGFSEEAIDEAKKLLFDAISNSGRLVSRRNNKAQRDLEDMLNLFANTDPENIPVFVAKDLHKLPPISFDHVDVTRLLKDLLLLQSQVREIKETYTTKEEFNTLKNELQTCRITNNTLTTTPATFVNHKRGAYLYDSGPYGMTFNNEASALSERNTTEVTDPSCAPCHTHGVDDIPSVALPPMCEPTLTSERITDKEQSTQVSGNAADLGNEYCVVTGKQREEFMPLETHDAENKSYSDILKKPIDAKSKTDEGQWQTQGPRKPKKKSLFIGNMGKASLAADSKFKAAESKVPVLISNVHKDVTEVDITDYIYNKTREKVVLWKLAMKKDKGYNSYKIYVNQSKLDIYLNDSLWPSGIRFRRFVTFTNISKDTKVEKSQSNREIEQTSSQVNINI